MMALALAVVAACADAPEHAGGAPGRGVYVPLAWNTARTITGHHRHVVEERIACTKCHELTSDAVGRVVPGRCAACHEKEARIEHAAAQARARFGAAAKADCTACHAFSLASPHAPADGGSVAGSERRLDSGAEAGSSDAGSAALHLFDPGECVRCHASQQGNTPGVAVHGTSECTQCHRPHDDQKPQPGACDGCHKDVTTAHAAHGRSAIQVCTTCHQHLHAPAREAIGTCQSCHAKEKPLVPGTALFADGHQECIGCHRPHDFAKSKAVECRSCHEDVHVLGAGRVAAHNACGSCHAPHAVQTTAEQACARCHTDVHPDHPKNGKPGGCVGCHDPHPQGATHAKVRSCSGCHQTASSDRAFHGGSACSACHAPHRFVLKGKGPEVCEACHAPQVTHAKSLAGHTRCQSCHGGLPHRPTTGALGCDTCHLAAHRETRAGHKECLKCHEPHSGSVQAACSTCHAEQHQTAPSGHRDCVRCHQPHTGSAANTACGSCHAEQTKARHGTVAQGCDTCHNPHGPGAVIATPACTSCHQPQTLPGLHKVGKHNACNTCHGGHADPPSAARTACLTCHTDRTRHFPEAPRCSSCHLFVKTR
jgi:hypothetical protein